ncbi:MAG TPA: PTS sugar transporter subunit IIA [Lysobacter sp.]
MPLHDLLTAPRVAILGDEALRTAAPAGGDRARVLHAAARLLATPDGEAAAIARSLFEREGLASTALGDGVALPHARSADLDHCRGAFLRLARPVDFGAPDGQPVDLVLALLVPERDIEAQLVRLAELAERFADARFRRALREAADVPALCRHLLAGSHPAPLSRAA